MSCRDDLKLIESSDFIDGSTKNKEKFFLQEFKRFDLIGTGHHQGTNKKNNLLGHLLFDPIGWTLDRPCYANVEKAANFIKSKITGTPTVAIICGSGLSKISDILCSPIIIPYDEIPFFPVSTTDGHRGGQLVYGKVFDKNVICMRGRAHLYEGIPLKKCIFPIRLLKLLSVRTVIITNAVGAVNRSYEVGDVVLIKDHVSIPALAGCSPLVGINDDCFGTRFPDMNNAYDKTYRKALKAIAAEKKLLLREGVYVMVAGPQYETPAENRFIATIGGDVIGMSGAFETIAARHAGLKVVALSLVSNISELDSDADNAMVVSHDNVLAVMEQSVEKAIDLVISFVAGLKE